MQSFRKATERDIVAVARIYDHIHDREEKGETTIGWIRDLYPTAQTARDALLRDDLFVCDEAGEILAAAIINRTQVPVYSEMRWLYPADENEVMVLHTLVIEPSAAGRGIGTRFVAFYEQYAKEQGCTVLRLDTNARNRAARTLYPKLGYREADIHPCNFNGIPGVSLVTFEKRVQ